MWLTALAGSMVGAGLLALVRWALEEYRPTPELELELEPPTPELEPAPQYWAAQCVECGQTFRHRDRIAAAQWWEWHDRAAHTRRAR